MMSVSRQTQTWSKNPQEPTNRSENKETLSAGDKQKYFNNEDVGSVLNKAADPNWVDPEKKPRVVGNNSLDKDAFLKLLLTQMKNQDPTNPLKSHEMSAQLAQFTSLEKLTNIDESINGLRKDQAPAQNYEALNLMGKAVSGDSAKILRLDPKQNHTIRFSLKGDAKTIKVDIKDGDGKVIRTLSENNFKSGKNEISWNGHLEDGTLAPLGEYHIAIDARNSADKKVWAETKFDGVIDGLRFTPQGPLLMVGDQQIRLSDVEKITSPTVGVTTPPPAAVSESQTVLPPVKNINQMAMSGGLMNQLKKQGVF